MGVWKCTMLIQHATNVSQPNAIGHRLAGYSESWYDVAPTDAKLLSDFRTLCERRAAMLPIGAEIVGQRYQRIDVPTASQTDSLHYPGSSGLAGDLPSSALFCKVAGDGKNFRPTYFRSIPDAAVVEGEFVRGGTVNTALVAFAAWLYQYSFRGKDLNAPQIPIVSIVAATKVMTTTQPHGLDVDDTVKIRNTEVGAVKQSGTYRVTARPSDRTVVLSINPGIDSVNGTMQKATVGYHQIPQNAIQVGRMVTKKVGRPFEQFVGRRGKR